jgi:primosomal protein N'
MFIIEVIPISKSVKIDTLSYFTSKEITIGSIVTVPLRSKNVSAIVIAIRNAEDIKSEIRNADFSLKKLDKVKSKEFFGKEFMEMVKDLALYNATSIGSVINSLAPEYLLENINKLKIEDREKRKSLKSNLNREKYAVQGDDEERHGEWKSLIRQEFAKKKSILFINPTIEDAEHSFELLERGIEGYAFLLHGSLDPKQIIETWNKIIAEDHPVVIITTGAFLSIYRSDIETIILDKESSRAYKIQKKPYLDIRNAVEILADKIKAKIFFADNLLRVETLYKETKSEIVVERNEFIQALRLVSAFSTKINDVKIEVGEGKKHIEISSSNSSLGENIYKIPIKLKGDSFSITFNWRFLIDGLKSFSGDEITLGVNSGDRPALLRDHSDKTLLYVVMPLKV